MAKKQFDCFEASHIAFIADQHMFFVATAASEGRVNMAPKDAASLKVVNPNKIVWVNLTGAENETGAHLAESTRMTRREDESGRRDRRPGVSTASA